MFRMVDIMINKFEKVEEQNCFEDGVTDILYFPVTDSEDFPQEIREKAKEMVNRIVHTHKLDISKLRLNVRVIVYLGKNGKWLSEISVVISDYSAFDDIWIEEEYSIGHENPLYESLKVYFMKRLEEILFGT